jgi:hypothetical protein
MDFLKIDVDGCDCHLLEELLKDPFFRAKVIQIELNHHVPPPIAYKDMCANDTYGRSSSNLDVWGCSMQAAYDLVQPLGYELLQHDWPDAVFIHSSYRNVFPCLLGNSTTGVNYERNYWVGFNHAKRHYTRFQVHQNNREFVANLTLMSTLAHGQPEQIFKSFIDTYGPLWTKRPLWIEMRIGNAAMSVRQKVSDLNRTEELMYSQFT